MSLIYSEEKKAIILNLFFPFSSSYKKRRKGKAASEVQHLWQTHCLITCSFHPLEGGSSQRCFGIMAAVAPQTMPGSGCFSTPNLGISQCWSTTYQQPASERVCDSQTLLCRALVSCAKEQTRSESMDVFYVWTLLGASLGFWRI